MPDTISMVCLARNTALANRTLYGVDRIKPITVGNDVFLVVGVIVLPEVTTGDNVVVSAGAVVTKDIPPDSVAAGVPTRVKKFLGKC